MGKLYKGECYPSTAEIREEMLSEVWTPVGWINSITDLGSFLSVITNTGTLGFVPPDCTYSTGATESYLGLTVDEVVETSWLVAIVLISAWAILIIKRTF